MQRKQRRQRALIIGCGACLVVGLGIVAVIAARSPVSVPSSRSQAALPPSDRDLRTARITSDPDGKGCWQQTFDNQSGRLTETQLPCETTAYDSNGTPIPLGTIHRLDAISKSFSNH